jgi:DNA polymerase III epsilon subunit-like protein
MAAGQIIVVDLETTGFLHTDHIVEVGICRLDLASGRTSKLFDQVVREHPSVRFSGREWIFSHSSLDYNVANKAPLMDVFRDDLNDIFTRYPATAFNKAFDFKFLRRAGFKITHELPCAMQCARRAMKVDFNAKKYSVQFAWSHYFPEIRYVEQHRAYDDALHEAQLIHKMHALQHWTPNSQQI